MSRPPGRRFRRNTDRPDEEGIKTGVAVDSFQNFSETQTDLMKKGLRHSVRFEPPPTSRNTDRPDEEGIKTNGLAISSGMVKHRQT